MTDTLNPTSALTDLERTDLDRCEATIARGLTSFLEVGTALLEIRDRRLYRERYATFAAYCHDVHSISANYARRLMGASEVVALITDQLPEGTPVPANEAQARPLADLPPEEAAAVWQEATNEAAQAGRAVSAALVSDVRQRREQPAVPEAPATPDADAGVSAAEPATATELTLPADLAEEWTGLAYADETVLIHDGTSLKLRGIQLLPLLDQAREVQPFLAEIQRSGFRVAAADAGYVAYPADPSSGGRIDALDVAGLALQLWRERVGERGLPDLPDQVIDSLFLEGWRYTGHHRWERDGEELRTDRLTETELAVEAGLAALIEITGDDGKPGLELVELLAKRGQLGLHASVDDAPGAWTITHLPTSLSVARSLREADIRAVFQELGRLDWNFRTLPLMPFATRQEAQAILTRAIAAGRLVNPAAAPTEPDAAPEPADAAPEPAPVAAARAMLARWDAKELSMTGQMAEAIQVIRNLLAHVDAAGETEAEPLTQAHAYAA